VVDVFSCLDLVHNKSPNSARRISIERAALADDDVLDSADRRIVAVVAHAAGLILRG